VLFPGLQGFHLVNADGRSSKLFEIQLSVLKSAHLVPWQAQVSALYHTTLLQWQTVCRWLTVLTKSTTLESFIASVEFFTKACMYHLPFSNCSVKKMYWSGKIKIITNRFQILQRDITILVWTQQFKLLSYIKQLICSQCLG
jgi:hypothetical protein